MKTFATFIALLISISAFSQEIFSATDAFLKANVKNGLVNYASLKRDPTALNALVAKYAEAKSIDADQEKAFLINAYNIFVIKGIVSHYPVEGPLAIDGFFDKKRFKLRGTLTSLNELEKVTLAKRFPDARLHFVLVCAAIGCPKLASFVYTPEKLEQQLEEQTRKVINDPTFIKAKGPELSISQLFDWYAADFGGKDKLVSFIQKYHLTKVKFSPNPTFYKYDWRLNQLK